MMKRILELYEYHMQCSIMFGAADAMVWAIKSSRFIRKGQQQMMADYLMWELLERGRI